jgi:hypothetical protein
MGRRGPRALLNLIERDAYVPIGNDPLEVSGRVYGGTRSENFVGHLIDDKLGLERVKTCKNESKSMQSNALTRPRTQLQPVACRKRLDLANATRAGLNPQSEITQRTAAEKEKRDTCGYVHSDHGSSSSERSDLHHQGIVRTPPRSSDDDLPFAQTGTLAWVPCR